MKVYVNSILYPVKTLGPGKRVGIWFQGCSIRCPGCMSVHTWERKKEYETNTREVIKETLKYKCSGITISGGEPFEQPKALKEILTELNKKTEDIIVYSGMKMEEIIGKFPWIKTLCSVLISEPFVAELKTDKTWKGSDNQTATVFKNRKFYEKWLNEKNKKKLQIINNTIVGIL